VNSLVSTWNCRAAVRKKLVVGNILPVCSWYVECTTTPPPTSLLGSQEEVLMPLGELLSLEDGDQGVFALAGPSPDLLGRHFADGPAKPKLQLLFNHSCTSCQSNSVQVQFLWYSVMSHWHGIFQLPILDNKYLLTAFPIHKFYNLGDIQQLIQLSAQHYLFHH